MTKETRSFDPGRPPAGDSPAQVNRSREQGVGMGQRELDTQADPAGNTPALEGISDNPQEDWGAPMDEGATYSANHTRRPVKTEAERGQGPKTRSATKDQISRRT